MISKHSQGARLIAAVLTVLTGLLSAGFGCPAFAGHGGTPGSMTGAGTEAMPCHGDRTAAASHDCHGGNGCPRCAGAVLKDTAVGDLAVSPSDAPLRNTALQAIDTALTAERPARATGPLEWAEPPPGSLTPVAFKTVLLN